MNRPQILVVEDDPAVRNLITTTLETQDYQFHTAQNGGQAIMEAVSGNPDVILLDLGLPDMDGTEIIKKVRSWSQVPIIVISARGEAKDKIEALDLGADDYLTKPFLVEELLARIRVALRRLQYQNAEQKPEETEFINGDLKIDYVSGCVWLKEKEVHLTSTEYRLLVLLAKNIEKVLTPTFITKEIWGSAWENNIASLRVFMQLFGRRSKRCRHSRVISRRMSGSDTACSGFRISKILISERMDHGLIAHDDQSFIVGKNMTRMGKRKYLLPFFSCKDTDVVTCTDGFFNDAFADPCRWNSDFADRHLRCQFDIVEDIF